MNHDRRRNRIPVAMTLVGVGALGLGLLSNGIESAAAPVGSAGIAATPEAALQQQSRFMGGNPSVMDLEGMSTLRLRFPAGSRSNWHSHSDGQLLMVEEGRGLTQDRGEEIQVMRPGEPWWTPAGREHWHGAHPDEDVVQLTIYAGEVDWMEPVTDEEYRAP